ncbi:hypothetical protein F5Y00DRAFT_235199 [Daldinia vernicosa]|uniref:uncharacterized protein n=1 Tax=Daldinia vernicosa TaxID=114800 RepID=UPI0020087E96|nr:uncharacterized protein F5Y00DRAFT_235199 [Daldinia vernicosa]KAI0849594.1 hypothetical protein F5Y00DRAFT_235199 [Daldinia vernicosa]
MAMSIAKRNVKLLEPYYEGRFEGDGFKAEEINIADCVLFSFLQFSKKLYGVDIVADSELRNLRRFYDTFKERDSAKISEDFYPQYIKELAPVWLE